MLAEVEQYLAVLAEAETVRDETVNAADAEYNENAINYQTHRGRANRAYDVYSEAIRGTWDTLVTAIEARRGSSELADRQAVFILDTCADRHHDQAVAVLAILPATAEELHRLSRENSWCGVFGRYFRMAEGAGVIPGVDLSDPETRVRRALAALLDENVSAWLIRDVMLRVDEIVAAAVAKATAPADGAPVDDPAAAPVD